MEQRGIAPILRVLPALALGVVLGFALALLLGPQEAGEEGDGQVSLRAEVDRAREEIALLRTRLEAAGSRVPAASSGGFLSQPPEAAAEGEEPAPMEDAGERPALTMEEREARARRTLALRERDPALRELHLRHSREEGSFPNWAPSQFLSDPEVNPHGDALSDEKKEEFELLHAQAFQAVRVLELKRQVAVAEAILRLLKNSREGKGVPQPSSAFEEGDLAVSFPGGIGLTVVLPRFAFPEVTVLRLEKEAAEVEWLLEAQSFLGGAR